MTEPDAARPDVGVVIVAAGSGVRFGDPRKTLALLGGRPLLAWSLDLLTALPEVVDSVVVAGPHTDADCARLVAGWPGARVVAGGATRTASARAGVAALDPAVELVIVHDAARPLASRALARRVIAAARESGAAVPALPVSDTLHEVDDDDTVARTPDRARLRAAQTPQAARRAWLERAYAATDAATDEGGLLVAAGYPVRLVEGEPSNLKVTWPGDLVIAEALFRSRMEPT